VQLYYAYAFGQDGYPKEFTLIFKHLRVMTSALGTQYGGVSYLLNMER